MRVLLTAAILVNVALLGFGQGFFGPPPVDDGRTPRPLSQRSQQLVTLSPALAPEFNPR